MSRKLENVEIAILKYKLFRFNFMSLIKHFMRRRRKGIVRKINRRINRFISKRNEFGQQTNRARTPSTKPMLISRPIKYIIYNSSRQYFDFCERLCYLQIKVYSNTNRRDL